MLSSRGHPHPGRCRQSPQRKALHGELRLHGSELVQELHRVLPAELPGFGLAAAEKVQAAAARRESRTGAHVWLLLHTDHREPPASRPAPARSVLQTCRRVIEEAGRVVGAGQLRTAAVTATSNTVMATILAYYCRCDARRVGRGVRLAVAMGEEAVTVELTIDFEHDPPRTPWRSWAR